LRDRLLKRGKLDHGVGNLARPQRIQALVQACHAFFAHHLGPTLAQRVRKWWKACLHAHLDGFHGAQGYVGKELGRGAGCKVDDLLGQAGGRQLVAVDMFEYLVEAVFARALHRVAEESRGPAEEDAAEPFFGVDHLPGLCVGLVESGVDLAAAFYLDEKRV